MKTCEWCSSPTPCHRCETILQLLDLLPDSETTMLKSETTGGEGLPPQMPELYHTLAFTELRASLERLRHHDPPAWAHTIAYYKSEWKTTRDSQPQRDRAGHIRRNRQGQILTELGPPIRKRIINSWILEAAVHRGIRYLIATYQGTPTIPDIVALSDHEYQAKQHR